MNGFITFLTSDNPRILHDEEDFDVFTSEVDDLVYVWLRGYIEKYNPGYTFDEVVSSIGAINISDDTIEFTLFNPYIQMEERYGFGVNLLEEIRQETKDSVERTFYSSVSINDKIFVASPEILSIIRSWYPEIPERRIINVDIMPYDNGKGDFEYDAQSDHLVVYYYSPDNEVNIQRLPNLHKGEYRGTTNGLMDSLWKERRKFMRLLTGNK